MSRVKSDKFHEKSLALTDIKMVDVDYDAMFESPMPLPPSARRADPNRRKVRNHSRQLVMLAVDDSRSMAHDGKAQAATEAVKDMLCEMDIRSDEKSLFHVVVFSFGDHVNYNAKTFGVPILDFPVDEIEFEGNSGKTRFFRVFDLVESLLEHYESKYLRKHEMPKAHPVPLLIFMSDGRDKGKKDPCAIADRIKTMKMSTGAPPLIVTVGIEFGGDEPDVNLLKRLASMDDESDRPAYFDVSDAFMLAQFLSKVASSGSSTAGEIFRATGRMQ